MSIFDQIAVRIIREQALVIGPLAWSEASKVSNLRVVDPDKGEIAISGNEKQVIDGLVSQYKRLFGQASVEACKEAAANIIADLKPEEIPSSLK